MKYRDLPTAEVTAKLIQVSFSTPSKNLQMYRLYTDLQKHQGYIENERVKLVRKYGEETKSGFAIKKQQDIEKFSADFAKILDAEIEDDIKCPDITEDDFLDENCCYPMDKTLWPNAKDIAAFMNMCNILKEEKSG